MLSETAERKAALGYQPALDGLRAVAAVLVVGFHARLPGTAGGFVGVEIFFVLSGFLITSLLRHEWERTGGIDLMGFWWRRIARLYPMLVLLVVTVVLLGPWLFGDLDTGSEALFPLSYTTNFGLLIWGKPNITGHTWSLAVEMQFYLLWPLLLAGLLRWPRATLVALVWLFAAATVWRVLMVDIHGAMRAYFGFDTSLSGLMLGACLAFLDWRPTAQEADRLGALGLLVLGLAVALLGYRNEMAHGWGILVVDTGTAMLMLALASGHGRLVRLFALAPLVRLGLWSYSIYLWHSPIARLVRDHVDGVTSFAIVLALSVALAAASYELFERPLAGFLRGRPLRPVVA